jgi:hypothetical protein
MKQKATPRIEWYGGFAPLILIIILAMFAVVGYFAYKYQTLSKQTTTLTQLKTSPSPTDNGVSNWKTYANSSGGYSFQYPDDWNAATNSVFPTNSLFGPNATSTSGTGGVEVNTSTKSVDGYIDELLNSTIGSDNVTSRESVVINGLQGVKISAHGQGPWDSREFFTKKGSSIYNIYINLFPGWKDSDVTNFDQILTTFKVFGQTTSIPTGTVTGKLCYPSEGIPASPITAKDLQSGRLFTQSYPGTSAGGKNNYTFELPEGNYHLKYDDSGYYDACAKDMSNATCSSDSSHTQTLVNVVSGRVTQNIDLCDFYYSPDQKVNLEKSF